MHRILPEALSASPTVSAMTTVPLNLSISVPPWPFLPGSGARSHGCQYFSYPGYTFSYFRDHHITDYEAPADIDLNEWIPVKAVIQDERADFYLNDQTQPVLTVKNMKHGKDPKGAVGLFTDIGTEAFFKDLEIEYFD